MPLVARRDEVGNRRPEFGEGVLVVRSLLFTLDYLRLVFKVVGAYGMEARDRALRDIRQQREEEEEEEVEEEGLDLVSEEFVEQKFIKRNVLTVVALMPLMVAIGCRLFRKAGERTVLVVVRPRLMA